MVAYRPPRQSTDSFQDRKWKETIAESVDSLEGLGLAGTIATTTGNQTINKPCGVVSFAAAATSLTVTNSLATTNSIVVPTILTNDATAVIKNVECFAGSFIIRLSTAPTGTTKVGFLVFRPF
jgi:hypothetical protein